MQIKQNEKLIAEVKFKFIYTSLCVNRYSFQLAK